MVKQIPLGGNKGAGMFALVDDDMHELLSKYPWNSHRGYAMSGNKAAKELGSRSMHRVVNKTRDGVLTDHIDGDTLNNQRSNLRDVTPTQNMMNSSKQFNKNGKYKGAYWDNVSHLWIGKIIVNGKIVSLGTYHTQRDAAIAYNNAATNYFGEYAKLNKIPDHDPDDEPALRRRGKWGKSSEYTGVFSARGNAFSVTFSQDGKPKRVATFPNEKFAAKIYDAIAVSLYGDHAYCHVNFLESLDRPANLNCRYVFKAIPLKNAPYLGVPNRKKNIRWGTSSKLNGKMNYWYFDTAELAAEHYDKIVLIYRDDMCTLINFPEKLPQYLAEIGDQIISPKPIVIPDLT